jgi:DNA-directed RNA polymerase specialized sigma24 family protein
MKRKDQVLALVDRKEFTYQQIADQLDCSTGYVCSCEIVPAGRRKWRLARHPKAYLGRPLPASYR